MITTEPFDALPVHGEWRKYFFPASHDKILIRDSLGYLGARRSGAELNVETSHVPLTRDRQNSSFIMGRNNTISISVASVILEKDLPFAP